MTVYYCKNDISVRTAVPCDVEKLMGRLRRSDVDEVWACGHRTPEDALLFSMYASILAFTVERKRTPVAMFGIAPDTITGTAASVWLLGTNDINKFKKTFMLLSRSFIPFMQRLYPVLYNWVDERNTVSIAWLQRCGAEFHEPKPFGAEGKPFRYFTLTGKRK